MPKLQLPKVNRKRVAAIGIPVLGLVLMLFMVSFAAKEQRETVCRQINIDFSTVAEKHFITDEEILKLLRKSNRGPVIGMYIPEIDLKTLENDLAGNTFIKDVQVYTDLAGTLHIDLTERKPIARIFSSYGSYYLDTEGERMPLSEHYTAHVPVITVSRQEVINEKDSTRIVLDKQLYH
ncbi:MAG: FtsQ-type POTRA domain-containing protein, partial [Bacteroidota bacterium]|nr:FtsQ-type POTRA domain-containing protein [Bacteroidota bacterium]